MRVRVLGSLEISDGTEFRPLGAAKQRALLAALVVRVGDAVSFDHLIDDIWAQQAPASAVNLIHGYVGALRRAMGDVNGTLLRTQAPGYQLVLPRDELDLRRFETRIADGRQALLDGDRRAASGLLGEALRLWRGPPFADVPPTSAVDAEAGRLEQLRQAALEARVDADLGLGRHAELVSELYTLTSDHPLAERFWSQLMLALYRSGRQAEALETYQRLYKLLDDELGVEPTRPVRNLHQQILTGDPALDASLPRQQQRADRTAGDPATVPRQLPAGIGDFTGRQAQLAQLDALLPIDETSPAPAVVISTITGAAGVGKTALAVHWAHRIAGRFPDGQLYVDLKGFDPIGQPVSTGEAVRGFLDALGVAPRRIPTAVEAQAALYRSLLADRRMLVVLDNARDADQVRPLLPGSPGTMALVTSRDQLDSLVASEAARPVTVDLLSTGEAYDLMVTRLGRARVAAEPEAVEAIVASCAGLPLALAIVAARAAAHPRFPLAALSAELEVAKSGLEPFAGGDTSTDLRAVFSWSYDQLNPDGRRLFRLLGVRAGPDITARAAASLAGRPIADVRRAFTELCRAHLLSEYVTGRYTCHDLLHAYAVELVDDTHTADTADTGDERDRATCRLLDHYLQTSFRAAVLLAPHRDRIELVPAADDVEAEALADYDQAMNWLTTERRVLLSLLDRYGEDERFCTRIWQLAWTLDDFLQRRGHWKDRESVERLGLATASRLGDTAAQARFHRVSAQLCQDLGRPEEAMSHLSRALEIDEQRGNTAGTAHTHYGMAFVLHQRERYKDSLCHVRRALELYRSLGHRTGEAKALEGAAWCCAELGEYTQALACSEEALVVRHEADDRYGLASAWDTLGHVHSRAGNYAKAVESHGKAVDQFRRLRDRRGEADALAHLADTQHSLDDQEAAISSWQRALAILEDLDHPDAETARTRLAALERSLAPASVG